MCTYAPAITLYSQHEFPQIAICATRPVGTGPDGRRIRRALKNQVARRAEEVRANLEAQIWKSELYGPQSVITFDQAALAYVEDGGDIRFLVKVTEQLTGTRLEDITPRTVRDAAKKGPTPKQSTRPRTAKV